MEVIIDSLKTFISMFYPLRYYMLIFILIYFLRYIPYIIKYFKSNYRKESGIGLIKFLFNTGYFGEGLTFMRLENIPIYSKILANAYIPTEDGTTEIDLVYINTNGIYVIESKNYSGWIFGSAKSREWTSNIYGKKYKFFNPIWQNKKHIDSLKNILPELTFKSLIVFSDRCEFKKVNANKKVVLKRNDLEQRILEDKSKQILTNAEVDDVYNKLKPYANRSEDEKQAHINRLNKKY